MSPLPANKNPESVAWITSNSLTLLEDQQRRAESLQTRAAQIAGFAGATVALGAPLARQALGHLDGCDQIVAAAAYFAGTGSLSLTILLSVLFVLRPRRHYAIGASEIKKYTTDQRFVTQEPSEIQFRTIKAVYKAVNRYEVVNSTKATLLTATAILFLVGLLLTIAVALILAADRL